MLRLLHIENIAVIESADISFDSGFNVLTGETGAGKSIVIDAISAISGRRAYRDMIRTGSNSASVRAIFEDVPQLAWFEENGVPYEADTTITREIFLDGKNLCRVNGVAVSVSSLWKLGIQLVNIHGQNESATLFDESNHLRILDTYAENGDLLEKYRACYGKMTEITKEIDRLTMDEGEKLRRTETLKYQIAEIDKASLHPGEDEALEQRRKLLQNAEKLSDLLCETVRCLYGDDENDGAASLLTEAERSLARLSRFGDEFSSLYSLVSDLKYQVQDAAERARDTWDSMNYSADELEEIESRLDVIHKLRRKYGADCKEILAYLENAKKELNAIAFSDDRIEELKVQLKMARQAADSAAESLHNRRLEAAESLTSQVREELTQLDMPGVRFSCQFTQVPLWDCGGDEVAFYMSANAGEALKPMSKVASGGELSRIMLAMKNVLSQQDSVGTLIFDEVDVGVSGRAAQKVAEKLKRVAQTRQVLCVTHLPQIAALAQTHLLIAKKEQDGRTYTTVTPLTMEGRKEELARIIGGAKITPTTLKSAEEMMSAF